MQVDLITRDYNQIFGLARYTTSLIEAIRQTEIDYRVVKPHVPVPVVLAHSIGARAGLDVRRFYATYPFACKLRPRAVKHLTVQTFSTLLYRRRPRATVITVHDLIPFLTAGQQQRQYKHAVEARIDRLSTHCLRRAERLIAVSEAVKRDLVAQLGYPAERIDVVLEGVDHTLFRPRPVPQEFRRRFGLRPDDQIVLYVGSEAPKKNLGRLVQAVAAIKDRVPNLVLVKVGSTEYGQHALQLQATIDQLGLRPFVRQIDHPAPEDLVSFYLSADVFVYPSLYEGFGLPPLEAMACGAPVIASNSTSIPEVVGDGGLLFTPTDTDALAALLLQLLTSSAARAELRARGTRRASGFSWERTARSTIAVYEKVAVGHAA